MKKKSFIIHLREKRVEKNSKHEFQSKVCFATFSEKLQENEFHKK